MPETDPARPPASLLVSVGHLASVGTLALLLWGGLPKPAPRPVAPAVTPLPYALAPPAPAPVTPSPQATGSATTVTVPVAGFYRLRVAIGDGADGGVTTYLTCQRAGTFPIAFALETP